MRISFFLLTLALAATTTTALGQERDSTAQKDSNEPIALNEVVVEKAHVVKKGNETHFYPTLQQKESATNAYGLLARLAPPELRIDVVTHSITALSNKGSVEVRINGLVASTEDLLALHPATVQRVEYTNSPGLRHSDDVGYVINFITRRADAGYTLGLDATQAVTVASGNGTVFGRLNRGKNELGLTCTGIYKDLSGARSNEVARYLLPDASVRTINRHDTENHKRENQLSTQLLFNRMDSAHYTFQTKLSGELYRTPRQHAEQLVTDGTDSYEVERDVTSRSFSPSLDLYLRSHLASGQDLTLNAVGTLIHSSLTKSHNEGTAYRYEVRGRSRSLFSEALYENKLRPFTFSTGAQFSLTHTDNTYSGDADARNRMTRQNLYLFGEIGGQLGAFSYKGGLGFTHIDIRQDDHHVRYDLLRPKVSLQYAIGENTQLAYTLQSDGRVSKIASTSDVAIRQNSLEWTMGNPDLRPSRDIDHLLTLSYTKPRISSSIELFWRQCHRPNMEKYLCESTADGQLRYIYTQTNQRGIDMFYAMHIGNFEIIPNYLSLIYSAGLFHFINRGDDYCHRYTTFNGQVSLTAYLGPITLSAYADNGWNFMEAEHRGHSLRALYFSVSYNIDDFSISAYCQQPLSSRPTIDRAEFIDRYVRKDSTLRDRDSGNFVAINLTWNFLHGHQYKGVKRTQSHKDSDAGIVR